MVGVAVEANAHDVALDLLAAAEAPVDEFRVVVQPKRNVNVVVVKNLDFRLAGRRRSVVRDELAVAP